MLFICLSVYFVKSLFYFHRCLLTIQILSVLYIFSLFYHFFSISFCIKIYTISSYSSHLYHFLHLFYNKINLSYVFILFSGTTGNEQPIKQYGHSKASDPSTGGAQNGAGTGYLGPEFLIHFSSLSALSASVAETLFPLIVYDLLLRYG